MSKIRGLARRIVGNFDEVEVVYRTIGGTAGTMLDVGAHTGSALAPFLAAGWSVHAFEPDPANRRILSSRYPGAVIDPRAVSEVDGEQVPLFASDVSTGISTLSPFHSTHKPVTTVETVRLDTYVKSKGVGRVDFLKTDIEGFDLFALRSFPWASQHPKAVVCEFEDGKTRRLGHDVHDIATFLRQQKYTVLVSEWEPIVEYGKRHKWQRLVRYPAEIAGDAWGNLIAVDPELASAVEHTAHSVANRVRVHQWLASMYGRR